MASLGDLWITVGAKIDGFKDAMSDIGHSLEGTEDSFKSFGEKATEWLEHPLDSAKSALKDVLEGMGPLGVGASVVAGGFLLIADKIKDLVLEEGKAAEATSNLADRLNLTFEETKKLTEMAQVAGVDLGVLTRVSMRLADALEDPTGSGKKVAAALDSMGISASNSGDALLKLLEKLSEIPDATERINKAHEVMGKGAVELEPLLRNYESLSKAVDALGGQLDTEMVEKLKKADDAADLLGIAWGHLKERLAVTFSPAVTAAINLLTDLLAQHDDSLTGQVADLTKKINEAGSAAGEASLQFNGFLGRDWTAGNPTLAGLIAQRDALYQQMQAQKEAIARSKDYNDALDESNLHQKRLVDEGKKALEDMTKAEVAFHNSVVDLYNSIPDTYDQYVAKLQTGGKTAQAMLGSVQADIDKASTLMLKMSGAPLKAMQDWVDSLTAARDELKKFAEADDFYKAAVKIQELTAQFPEQAHELALLDSGFRAFFNDMEAGAASVPTALNKLDIAGLTSKVLAGQKQLDDQTKKTATDFDKAWMKFQEGAQKARDRGIEVTGTLEDVGKMSDSASATLQRVLPPAIYAAYLKAQDLRNAFKDLGIVANETGHTMSQQMHDFELIAQSDKTSLEDVELAWSKVSNQVNKLAQSDLPTAIRISDEYIDRLKAGGAAQGQIFEAESKRLQMEIAAAAQRGQDATAQIISLENLRLKTDQLSIQTHALGDVYIGLNKAFTDVFDNLGKGITDLIVHGGSAMDMLKSVWTSFETDIVGSLAHGLTEGLKNAFLESGVGQAISGFLTKIFGDIFGGLFNIGTTATTVASTTANTTALAANTAALAALTAAVGGSAVADTASTGASTAGTVASSAGGVGGAIGSAVSSGLAATVSAITGVVSAVTGVISVFQGMHQETSLNAIEHNTRYSMMYLGEQVGGGIFGALLTYLPQLPHLVDIWGAVNTVRDALDFGITDRLNEIVMNTNHLSDLAPGGGNGMQVTFDFRGANISDDRAANDLMEKWTTKLREVLR